MNARVLVALACVIGAIVALAWPQGAVRVAAVLLGVLAGGLVLDSALARMARVAPLLVAPPSVPTTPSSVPTDLSSLRRELTAAAPGDAIPDLVFSRAQTLARRRVVASRGLDPFAVADHPRLAADLSPTMFRLVMSGLAGATAGAGGEVRHGYVPVDLRPTIAELPALIEEIASL